MEWRVTRNTRCESLCVLTQMAGSAVGFGFLAVRIAWDNMVYWYVDDHPYTRR